MISWTAGKAVTASANALANAAEALSKTRIPLAAIEGAGAALEDRRRVRRRKGRDRRMT